MTERKIEQLQHDLAIAMKAIAALKTEVNDLRAKQLRTAETMRANATAMETLATAIEQSQQIGVAPFLAIIRTLDEHGISAASIIRRIEVLSTDMHADAGSAAGTYDVALVQRLLQAKP
ncbi:hypothetical protein ACXIUS_01465 [Bosea thiooxidans]